MKVVKKECHSDARRNPWLHVERPFDKLRVTRVYSTFIFALCPKFFEFSSRINMLVENLSLATNVKVFENFIRLIDH